MKNMKKNAVRETIGLSVILCLYLIAVFVIPFVRNVIFWVSLLFTLIAFGVTAAALYIAFIRKPDAKSRFYGFPIARIGVIYGLVQLITGLVFMALAAIIPLWVAFVVYAAALAAAVIGLISAESVVTEIHAQDARLRMDVSVMRSLQSKVQQMALQMDVPSLKALAEEIRYSDPVSSAALDATERDLSAAIDDLQTAVVEADAEVVDLLCRNALAILAERNRLCKLNKA